MLGETEMAEVTARRAGEMVRGLFAILAAEPDGLAAKEALARLAKAAPPTAFEAADYPKRPGVRRYEKLVRFHTIGAVKAGWMTKVDGMWSLTDAGRTAVKNYLDPEAFYREEVRLYRVWHEAQVKTGTVIEGAGADADVIEAAGTSVEEAREQAWEEVQTYLHGMPPYDFQRLVGALLRGMGYFVSWEAPGGADDGIDIIAYTDPLGAKGPRIKVQVKRLGNKVDVGELRSFMAVLGADEIGIYVAASGFTRDAERDARREQNRKVTLLDLGALYRLWVEYQRSIPEESRLLLPLTPVYYLDRS
jgi:restriction system protein